MWREQTLAGETHLKWPRVLLEARFGLLPVTGQDPENFIQRGHFSKMLKELFKIVEAYRVFLKTVKIISEIVKYHEHMHLGKSKKVDPRTSDDRISRSLSACASNGESCSGSPLPCNLVEGVVDRLHCKEHLRWLWNVQSEEVLVLWTFTSSPRRCGHWNSDLLWRKSGIDA